MTVRLSAMPNLGRSYLAALATFTRAAPDAATRLPATELAVSHVRFDPERIARYNEACGLPAGRVANTYPFVFTFPLQLALLTRPDSPLRLPGLVHLGVSTEYRRPFAQDERVSASCVVDEQTHTPRGLEFSLALHVADDDGATVWRATSRILARGSERARARTPRARPDPVDGPLLADLVVPASIGRRYAQASGDWNPIHLGRLGARAAGFDRPIAHGMWTLARTLAVVDGTGVGALRADFVAPLYLPARLAIRGDRARAAASDARSGRLVALTEMKEIP